MINEIKQQLSEIIRMRSSVLVMLSYNPENASIVSDEIDTIRKLKDAYDKLDEVS
jgi:hypothetical protein